MHEVTTKARSVTPLGLVLPEQQSARMEAAVAKASAAMAGRTFWNVSSTASGGGVAEMLHNLVGYLASGGIEARWLVLDAEPEFFAVTKRLHNAIHGAGVIEEADHDVYGRTLENNLPMLLELVRPGDVVLLHDPQTGGLVREPQLAGAKVIWRSHIGLDTPNGAWEFLRRYIESADAFIFSREQYAPSWITESRLWVIPPSIDPLSPKNRPIDADECVRILRDAGLLPADDPQARLVVQVSRWDALKDMDGVLEGFRRADLPADVRLILAGSAVTGVTDDPEGARVLADCTDAWQQLPEQVRHRVMLASLPMEDMGWNATVVNALQRHATVVVQKSLAEGFGLTVAEAMWKGKPVIATAVGGIQDQISTERTGLLVTDPADLDEFASQLRRVIADPDLAGRLGQAARDRVLEQFLDDRQLAQTCELLQVIAEEAP